MTQGWGNEPFFSRSLAGSDSWEQLCSKGPTESKTNGGVMFKGTYVLVLKTLFENFTQNKQQLQENKQFLLQF